MNSIIPQPPWTTGGLPFLNVAATCTATRALGPGLRSVVWVQGCPFRCAGCIAPDWIPQRISHLARPEAVAEAILADPDVSGLTFSGGEPMLQAAGLAAVARSARRQRELTLICFTGFTLEKLKHAPPGPGVSELLDHVDVLIDGLYVAGQNNNRGLRGSNNQRVHYLTNRLAESGYDFEGRTRQAEVLIGDGTALLVGVPPQGVMTAFRAAIVQAKGLLEEPMV